ncbi:two-component sensor histidine kinase [Paucibacter sp. KBW04]|uniref:ATP-binding protein n=1 Tax=Paucibacter sp. KBW04 TaxID=2153361 RepID=UPI000F55BF70|nr:ATP-binding protein [Paucibacter sp. KBW04]RQO56934.1 two-component sensor histidine kinase [Paucibacter sp. KBW04]
MSRHAHSLQGRLLAWVLALVGAVWLSTALLTWFDARHELTELLDSHLAQAAALLVVQQSHDLAEDAHELDTPSLHHYAPKVAFQVFHEGELALRSANAPVAPMLDLREARKQGFQTVVLDGLSWRVFATRGQERDVQVLVGEQIASRDSILWAVLRSTLWPMLLALPLLAVGLWWGVRRGFAPMRRMGQELAQRPAGDLHALDASQAPREMQPMLTALNGLFQRIAELMAAERRFTADAAHELRTPIAAIRTQAQVALAEPEAGLREHALQATLAGCDRASHLVDQLLTLSRLESGEAPPLQALDLAPLLREQVAQQAVQAVQKGQTVAVDAPGLFMLAGNASLLAALLRNLLDNAIRYSPNGAQIRLRLERAADRVRLTVADSGPGMSESDLQRLGERFFRVLGHEQPGSGLGWSIVRRIVAAHGGRVQLSRSAELGGLAVQIDWPGASI